MTTTTITMTTITPVVDPPPSPPLVLAHDSAKLQNKQRLLHMRRQEFLLRHVHVRVESAIHTTHIQYVQYQLQKRAGLLIVEQLLYYQTIPSKTLLKTVTRYIKRMYGSTAQKTGIAFKKSRH